MATLNTTNPEYITWEYDQVEVVILGGIRIDGLDRMRVTLKIQWKEQVNHLCCFFIGFLNDLELLFGAPFASGFTHSPLNLMF